MANNKISLFFKSLLLGIFISGFGVNGHAATLPAGYTELQYIENTGTQYIDTGIKASLNTKAEGVFEIPSDDVGQLFGSYDEGAFFRFYVPASSLKSNIFDGVGLQTSLLPEDVSRGTKIKITLDKTGLYVGNKTFAYDVTPSAFTATSNIYIGMTSSYTGSGTLVSKGKVYSFKLYDNDTLVRDFVPAKNSSNVIGMYDTVGNRFYTNAGTGTFTGGRELDPCRNLLDKSEFAKHYHWYIATSRNEIVYSEDSNMGTSDWIKVTPGQTYTFSTQSDRAGSALFLTDEYGKTTGLVVSNIVPTAAGGTNTYTIPSGYNYIVIQTQPAYFDVDIQIEKGSTATPYTSYDASCHATCPNGGTLQTYTSATGTVTQNGTPTPTNPIEPVFYKQGDMVLRKVGDIADSYDATTGKITRRVGVKVLNGTENWKAAGTSNVYYVGISDVARREKTALPSTHYVGSVDTNADMADNTVKQTSTSSITDMGTINVKQTSVGDLNGFKTFLAQQYDNGTPVKVYYVLATETTEDWAAEQCTSSSSPIKIATTAYNSARFSPVVTELNNTIATIRSVVTNTINQTKAIADLQAKKQTRPDETCPAGKKCLLVEDNDGQPHWYEIIENAYGLPSGYAALEYLQSTGTQYIDTGLKLNQNNIVEVRYSYHTESDISTSGRIFGARYTSGSRNSFSIGSNSGRASTETPAFAQFGDSSALALNNIVIGQWNTYKVSADGFYINGVKQGDLSVTTFETPFTVKLFAFEQASSSSGTPSIGGGVGRCKQFKVWNGDTLVMDLIPAKNSSNVLGMYDLVSGQFFTNQGTGTFTAGPEI